MDRYEPAKIEAKWQEVVGARARLPRPEPGEPGAPDRGTKTYVLEMLPYPSGELHMGHVLNYMLGEVVAHFRRRHGYAVLRPMGYDSFGLPAENAAIREGGHPREVTERNIAAIRAQMERMGWAIDWDRGLATHDPRTTAGRSGSSSASSSRDLAYRKEAPVKWCPNDQTVLANEQVIDGRCERCGAEVEARNLEQWFFRITAYADALLDEMALLESWPERVLTMQRNWIGRSRGRRARLPRRRARLSTSRSSPRGRTRSSAPPSSSSHPSIRSSPSSSPAPSTRRRCSSTPATRRRARRRARGEGEGRRLHGPPRGEPGDRRADPDLGRRLRAHGVRDGRDHGRPCARRARLRVRAAVRPPDPDGRRAGRRRRAGRDRRRLRRALGRRGARQLGRLHAACRRPKAKKRIVEWLESEGRGRRSRSATACATGCSPASATGAARSRSCTATGAASCRSRTTTCRCCSPT